MKMSEKPLIKRAKKRPEPTGQLGFHPRKAAASPDTVPAMLSPGEYVLSREDMSNPLVQALVQHLSGMGGAPAGGVAVAAAVTSGMAALAASHSASNPFKVCWSGASFTTADDDDGVGG